MTVFHVKSSAITDLDGLVSPFLVKRATAGEGAAQRLKTVNGYVTETASAGIDSTHQLARLPSTAKVKEITVHSLTQGATGIYDVGAYYATDGLSASSVTKGTVDLAANTIDQDFFADATGLDVGGSAGILIARPGITWVQDDNAGSPAARVSANTQWTADLANTPLWQALGIATDPGGNIDIVLTNTEAAGTAAAKIGFSIKYSE